MIVRDTSFLVNKKNLSYAIKGVTLETYSPRRKKGLVLFSGLKQAGCRGLHLGCP